MHIGVVSFAIGSFQLQLGSGTNQLTILLSELRLQVLP